MNKEEMINAQKEMLREDTLCYHTQINKSGVFKEILRNGIEEEFYKELLSLYNKGFDFGIVFNDDIEKSDKDKRFIGYQEVAQKLANNTKNNNKSAYLEVAESAFLNGVNDLAIKSKEVNKIIIGSKPNQKWR